jgi:hypothetical protein
MYFAQLHDFSGDYQKHDAEVPQLSGSITLLMVKILPYMVIE